MSALSANSPAFGVKDSACHSSSATQFGNSHFGGNPAAIRVDEQLQALASIASAHHALRNSVVSFRAELARVRTSGIAGIGHSTSPGSKTISRKQCEKQLKNLFAALQSGNGACGGSDDPVPCDPVGVDPLCYDHSYSNLLNPILNADGDKIRRIVEALYDFAAADSAEKTDSHSADTTHSQSPSVSVVFDESP